MFKGTVANYPPYIIEKTAAGDRLYSVYTKLLEDRIIFLGTEINDAVANGLVAQFLYLEQEDAKAPHSFLYQRPRRGRLFRTGRL